MARNNLIGKAIVGIMAITSLNVSANSNFQQVFSEDAIKPRPFSGVAAVAKDGKIVFSHASKGFNLDSRFIIGSLSKQITAVLVIIKAEKKQLDLDSPVSRYLPGLHPSWADKVNLRHLLTHTSGIEATDKPLKTEPGKVFAYSNLGYDLLGKIVSSAPVKNYAGLAKLVFKYCDMPNTKAVGKSGLVSAFHETDSGDLREVNRSIPEDAIPSGGVISTVNDLVKWNQCLHEGRLFKKEHYQQMVTAVGTRTHRWGDLGYGYGLQIGQDKGLVQYSHSGYVPGFISTMTYNPDDKTTMVILENTSWNTNNMKRVFYYHDKLHQLLK